MSGKVTFSDSLHRVYAEQLAGSGKNASVVMIPGGYHTGVCYTCTPDGRTGWAQALAKYFKNVYVTDLPGTGRSGDVDFSDINGKFLCDGYGKLISSIEGEVILVTHSLSGPLGFKLAELFPGKITHLISIESGLLGNVQEAGEPISETDEHVMIKFKGFDFDLDMSRWLMPSQQIIDRLTQINTKRFPSGDESKQQYIASLQAVHPQLMYERFNIHQSQLRIADFDKLESCKFLIVTGTEDIAHPDEDYKIFDLLKQNGLTASHYKLGERGINGNGHMMMLEDNSDEIIGLICHWLGVA